MSTISRETVIDIITEYAKQLKKEKYHAGAKVVKEIIRMITELTGFDWTPCSEGLPKSDGDYLVCFEEGYREDYGLEKIGIAPFEVDCEGFGIWQERFDPVSLGSLGSDWVDIKVVAWMPLPEPYYRKEKFDE